MSAETARPQLVFRAPFVTWAELDVAPAAGPIATFDGPGAVDGAALPAVEAGGLRFSAPGSFRLRLGDAARKIHVVDPAADAARRALALCGFVAANIVHSQHDAGRARHDPRNAQAYDFEAAVEKLFRGDQPVAFHCGPAASFLALLLAPHGIRARRVSIKTRGEGHLLSEVDLPGDGRRLVVDADYGVALFDAEGDPVAAAELPRHRAAGFESVRVRALCRKYRPERRWNMPADYAGPYAWHAGMNSEEAMWDEDAYRAMLRQYCDEVYVHELRLGEGGPFRVRVGAAVPSA